MVLIIGGVGQGKRAYALRLTGLQEQQVVSGLDCPLQPKEALVLDSLHELVRRWIEAGLNPLYQAEQLAQENPDLVVICNEVGCGVVPMTRTDRDWREAVGRVCCLLAARATRVDRVFCGLGTTLKGGQV